MTPSWNAQDIQKLRADFEELRAQVADQATWIAALEELVARLASQLEEDER